MLTTSFPNFRELYSNNISGRIPFELGNLTNLVSLDLYLNRLNGPIPDTLGKLQKLRFLYELFILLPLLLCVCFWSSFLLLNSFLSLELLFSEDLAYSKMAPTILAKVKVANSLEQNCAVRANLHFSCLVIWIMGIDFAVY